MDAAHTIREAVARVASLRAQTADNPGLAAAITAVKRFQASRFAGTYADLLTSAEYAGATRFFLDDLYSEHDYSERDTQFARIAGALQTIFPSQVVATAVLLAQLHVLTEELDHHMASVWMQDADEPDGIVRYIRAWQAVGSMDARKRQLDMVLAVGAELERLTRAPGLRLMLRMMRRPAVAAGMGSLQHFLETGFDTFAAMSRKGSRARTFLDTIRARETGWIERLFSPDLSACATALGQTLNTGEHQPANHG